MDQIIGALDQMVVMLIICALGFVGSKAMVLHKEEVRDFTRLLINIALPCMLLSSVNDMENGSDTVQMAIAGGLAVAQFLALLVVALVCNLVLRVPADQRKVYIFMAICTNTGFLGLPLISAVLGSASVVYCGIFIAVLGVFMYSFGFGVLTPCEPGAKHSIPWRSMLNPATIASLAAIVLVVAGFQFPPVICEALSTAGAMTAPLAMLMVGIIIAGTRFGDVVSEWRLYPFIVIRQLIVPALLYVLLHNLGVDPLVSGVFTLMFSMPVGSMAPAFATLLGADAELPAKGVVLSTVASFAIVPLLVVWMSLF